MAIKIIPNFKNYTLKFLVQQKQLTEMVRDMDIIHICMHRVEKKKPIFDVVKR